MIGSSPRYRRLTMADMVADALAVLDAAGVQQAHVLGASMGGMIAQQLPPRSRPRRCGTSARPPWLEVPVRA
jgi:pimeloyl-ACP methyl ester carboxylesterase